MKKKFISNISIQYLIITLSTWIVMAVCQMHTLPLFATLLTPFLGLGASAVMGLLAFMILSVIALSVQVLFKLSKLGLALQVVFGTVSGSLAIYLSYLFVPAIFVSNFSFFAVIYFSICVTATIFLISFAFRFMNIKNIAFWPKR